jgi:hypothetical protein
VRRRLLAFAAVALAALAVVAVVLTRGGGEEKRAAPRGDARAEALAYAPREATVIVGVDTGTPAAGLIVPELVPRLTNGALRAVDVQPLLGNEAVVALFDARARRGQLSVVARDVDALRALARRLRPDGSYRGASLYAGPEGSAVAIRGAALVAAPDQATLRRALDVRADPRAHLTGAQFDGRLADLPRTAPVRAVFDAKAIVASRLTGVLRTRWGRSLGNGAAVLQAREGGLTVPFRLQTDAARIVDADLPIGPGARAPHTRGSAPLLIGVRDLSRLLRFLRRSDPARFAAIDSLQNALPSFVGVDVDGLLNGLTGDATISSPDLLDHLLMRTDPRDPGAFRTPLQRLSTISGLLQRLGIDNIELDEEPGDAYRLLMDQRLVLRAGVFGRTLVATNEARANLRAAAAAPPAVPVPGAAGGLTVRMQASTARRLLTSAFGLPAEARLVLDRVGDLTGWAWAERDGVRGRLDLAVR